MHRTLRNGVCAFAGTLLWLFFTMPVQARLGQQYSMALGNPDGASTNSASRTKFLINTNGTTQRAQYSISYNDDTHQANWVSWSYSLADDGTQARTDYWQTEEWLPSGYLKIGTATFGTGWDRGHMCPSADRTLDLTNNQVTFRMSNIIPQASQNNQGLWAQFEDYCRTLAANNNEILITTGPAQFTGSRLGNQMSIAGSIWKIAVVVSNATSSTPANERINTNARVIAILTPNTSTGLGTWQSYITSVEHIEDVTGYNFFNAITNRDVAIYLKNLVDTGTGPNSPTVVTTFNPALGAAGTSVTISGYNFGGSPMVQFNDGAQVPATVMNANTITVTVPPGATTGYITVQGANGTDTSYEPFTVPVVATPTLSVAPNTLSGLTANQGAAGTAVAYVLTGTALTGTVTVTAPANFEVSKDGAATFAGTQSFSPDIDGSLGAQIYARIKSGAPAGNVSGTVSHSSGGATTANLTISGAVISTAPALSLSTNSLTGLSAQQNSAGASKTYTVSGANLAGSISISATAGFEVSTDNATFGTSVSLSPSSGALNNATVYVRLAASSTVGTASGTITHSGGGLATAQTLNVSGDVTSTAPSLVLSTNSITGFTAVQNNPGGSKTYTVSGAFLTSNVSVGAPVGFEIGTNTTTFTNSLLLAPTSGTLASTTIYARLAASATTGTKSGAITHTGGGVAQQGVSVAGTVSPAGSGETSTVVWNFATASPTSGVPSGVTVSDLSQGNNNGTTALITSTSASSGYTGASGGNNAGAAARIGALNTGASGSAYFEFTVTPQNGSNFDMTGVSFGSRSTGTGPTAYVLRSSLDNYTANIVTGTFSANSTWALFNHTGLAASSSSPVTFRLFGYNGTGSPSAGQANWRIDDLKVTISSGSAGLTPPVITSAKTATATAYESFQYQIAANNSPTDFSAAGLPEGLSVNTTTGRISGTATTPGVYAVILTASNANGDGTATLTLTVNPQPAPVITSATTATAAVNTSFQYQITASNTPTGFGATGLPAGFTVDTATGLISGTPSAIGTFSVNITASNATGEGTATLLLTVDPDPNAPLISSALSVTAPVDKLFSYQITAGNSPSAYLADNLPAWLHIDPLTGTISGTPTATGTSNVTITAINSYGSDTRTLTITVLAPVIEVSTETVALDESTLGAPGSAQSYTLTGADLASAITVLAPENFEISGDGGNNFADELTFEPAPDRRVNATIHVRMKASAPLGESSGGIIHSAADAVPKYVQLTGSAGVNGATIGLSAEILTGFSAKVGTPSFVQSYNVSGIGLTEPVVITAPNGFQISTNNTTFTNSVTLTPDNGAIAAREIFVRLLSQTAGTYTGPISHIGGGAADKYLALSGTVTQPVGPPIISYLSGSSYTNATFSNKITAGGSLPVTSYGASNLPTGLAINTTNGVVSGKVATAGTYTFQVSASTQDGTTTTNYTLRVVSTTEQNAIPLSVVINKYQNGYQYGSPDRVELLVTGDTNDAAPGPPVDLRGMIIKDFENNMGTDTGGKYQFGTNSVWSSVKAGTLIVLSAGTSAVETQLDSSGMQGTNWVLNVNLDSTSYFTKLGGVFDIGDTDMVLIKPGSMGIEGVAGGIHALAGGSTSTQFNNYKGKKIWSENPLSGTRTCIYAINDSSSLSDYALGSSGASAGRSLTFGAGNSPKNSTFITSLRNNLDQTPPLVTLIGDATVQLVVGDNHSEPDPGATAFDEGDNQSKTVTRSGTFNTSVAGTNTITYFASDNSGNVGTATRTIIVAKGTPSVTQWPTASSIIAGQKLLASLLTGGTASAAGTFAWTSPGQKISSAGTANYLVTFTPGDTANYNTVTGMVSVTANQGTALETWAVGYGLTGADAASAADPDRDGLNNLLEFDLGRDPTRGDGWARGIAAAGGQLKVIYLQRKGANLTVQTSTDLAGGFGATAIEPSLTSPQPGDITSDYEQYEVTVPPVNGRIFLRIRDAQP